MTVPNPIKAPQTPLEQAHALFQQKKFAEAIPLYRSLLQQDLNNPLIWANLGIALRFTGQTPAALINLKRALELSPDSLGLLKHYIYCLMLLNRKEEALQAFATALRMSGNDFETRSFYAFVLREFDMNEEALAQYHAGDALDVEHIWCRTDIYLRLGRFKEAWKDFEIRWKLGKNYPFWSIADQEKTYPSKRWTGESFKDKTLFIYEEQGFGDSILCSRFIPLVKARGGRVIFKCRKDLHRLFSAIPGIDLLTDAEKIAEKIDYHVPVMSLPGIFDTEVAAIPPPAVLHIPENQSIEAARLLAMGQNRFKVGIVWVGKPIFAGNYKRSAAFARFLPLTGIPGVQLYSLQKGPAEKELADSAAQALVPELGPHLNDFADTAAVLKSLDLVIMTDSSVVHLAGSIGCPVWNLISNCAFWVFLMNREDSPWYPSMRLFRQPEPGDWDSVFEKVAAELTKAVALKKAGKWAWSSRT